MKRLQQRPLLGLLVNPLGSTARALELYENELRVIQRGNTRSLLLDALTSPPVVCHGLFGATLTAMAAGQNDVVLRGAAGSEARAFADHVRNAWVHYNLLAFEREADRIAELHAAISALARPTLYPAACRIESLLKAANELDVALLSKVQPEAIGPRRAADVAMIRSFVADPRAARQQAIAFFVQSELDRWKDFFDTIESKPLTPEQPSSSTRTQRWSLLARVQAKRV